jgi:voltage-gated potassium channel
MNWHSLLWRIAQASSVFRIWLYLSLFVTQIIVYTILFHHFYPIWEGGSVTWIGALLFVLETITTTGYGDMLPFESEATALLAILMMLSGIVMVFMVVPLLLAPYITSLILATPPRRIRHEVTGHVIIVGFSEFVRSIVESLAISDIDVVIVVDDEETARDLDVRYRGRVYVIWGSYANPHTWEHVWLRKASNVVVCERERRTASILLGIRDRTSAQIIAIVDDLSFDRYLRYAGAEYVLSPKNSTGRILARHAVMRVECDTLYGAVGLEPAAPDFCKPPHALRLVMVPVADGSRAVGKTLRDLGLFDTYGADVLFFWRGGRFVSMPTPEDEIDESSMLFVLGRADAVARLMEEEFALPNNDGHLAVIAGFGDVGRAAYAEFSAAGIDCVVVDRKRQDVVQIIGNAEDEEVLREARIDEARYCVVAVNDDSVNIFTTLMARNLNPRLRILARANDPSSVDKLYRAGADYVALLPTVGGQVVAGIILANVARVLVDLPDGQKVIVKHREKPSPVTVGTLEYKAGARIVGIEDNKRSRIRPSPEEEILPGDAVVAVGEPPALKRFIRQM